ncbi:DJ-1/PfpI family protein [Fusibacter ferrireducens]|uniref:DJ-1/PfpI family protein n=1 Tax=Fusibacter ferrireducens TaxID=2785058 RepID=A0ABR9ZN66_9FIRM|nr:DJ-1/PfpI family protein [Fusibacter ferrireducens]MBF4691912.1 DJ-1/PfpI family protein [Fusibacter ferrireducens]
MKTYVLIYEGFVQFEVVLANYFMKTVGDIITVGLTDQPVTSQEGFITIPHITLNEVNVDNVDLLIIPGGDPKSFENNKSLSNLLQNLHAKKVKIGGICSGTLALANSGLLKGLKYTTPLPITEFSVFDPNNYLDQNIVVSGNIITAKANGYVDFGLEIGKMMSIYKDDADYEETIQFFKYFKG